MTITVYQVQADNTELDNIIDKVLEFEAVLSIGDKTKYHKDKIVQQRVETTG